MYSSINLQPIIERAKIFVSENDRALYNPFFLSAEKFISGEGIIIGGAAGVALCLSQSLTVDLTIWDLYCLKPFSVAKRLADYLYTETKSVFIPQDTISMETKIRNSEFTLSVYSRLMFRIYGIGSDKIYRAIRTVTQKGFFGNPVKVFSREIFLPEIYRRLYSPGSFSTWAVDLQTEKAFWIDIGAPVVQSRNDSLMSPMYAKILAEMSKTSILLGEIAAVKLEILSPAGHTKLQFLSAESLQTVHDKISNIIRDGVVKTGTYDVLLPGDFQLKKHSIFLHRGGSRILLFDFYNSPQYELIPFFPRGKNKIASPYVLLRFLFIDIWLMRLVCEFTNGDSNRLLSAVNKIISIAGKIRSFIDRSAPSEIFQTSNHEGIFTKAEVEKKKLIALSAEKFPPYFPAKKIEETPSREILSREILSRESQEV